MFTITKSDETKLELAQSLIRNTFLKEKYENLDNECQILANRIISSQLARAEDEQSKIVLRKDLNSMERLCLQESNELEIARKTISTMSSMLEEENQTVSLASNKEKSLDELLKLKDEMIKCLQEELVEVRLNTAENDNLINELKLYENELLNENMLLKNSKPISVSTLQEDLLAAKIRQMEITSELSGIKNQLKEMLSEIRRNVDEKKSNNSDGIVILPNKLAMWKSNINEKKLTEIDFHKSQKSQLENEAICLRKRINELEIQNNAIRKQLYSKHQEKIELENELLKTNVELESIFDQILETKHQISHFEKSANNELLRVQSNKFDKSQTIIEYSKHIEELLLKEAETLRNGKENNGMKESNLIEALENEVHILQTKINKLRESEDLDTITTFNKQEHCSGSFR